MTYTGGQLNWLNGQARVSDPSESVHIMSLIGEHDPDSPDELYDLIEYHYEEDCECGVQSGGTIEDFGRWLYDAQQKMWDEYRYTLEECIEWEYDLFIMQSLKGYNVENEARELFERSFTVTDVDEEGDHEYRVDMIIGEEDDPIAGIQVKPESYRNVRDTVQYRNDSAHEKIDEPILYLYYDYDTETFTNVESVLSRLYELVKDEQ